MNVAQTKDDKGSGQNEHPKQNSLLNVAQVREFIVRFCKFVLSPGVNGAHEERMIRAVVKMRHLEQVS